MSHLTSTEIFATTPRRVLNFKTQSVDRNGFSNTIVSHVNVRPEIKFENLKKLAPSKALGTPSRMIMGKKKPQPQSEQISRLNRPTVSSSLKTGEEPNTNLMEKFKANKSILKRPLSPPSEEEEDKIDVVSSTFDNDLATTLNTMKNTGFAKDVLNLLSDPESHHPKKRKRAVTFDENKTKEEATPLKIMEALQLILQNQHEILRRIEKLESER